MERRSVYVACLLLTAALATITECRSPLKISAFNIKVFGRTKLSRTEVVGVLKQIVRRYDIVLVQEIRDSSETTIPQFVDIVNDGSSDQYEAVVSERLGRTTSKEQYAFLYRTRVVEVVGTYQYEDSQDRFEREPFSVLFREREGGQVFFLVGVHMKPSDVIQELEALGPAFQSASNFHGNSRGVVMGDFNAGCSYLSRSAYEELSLVKDPAFIWLLGYDSDTTVASSSCSYDRFIVHESLNSSVVMESAKIFNFTQAYSLSAQQAVNVSDHYPIEFQLLLQSEDYVHTADVHTTSSINSTPPPSSPGSHPHTSPPLILTGLITLATIRHFL